MLKKTIGYFKKQEKTDLIFYSILLLSVLLRFIKIGTQNLWYDESYSWGMTRFSFSALIHRSFFEDVHPPFYYIILKIWRIIFGESEYALRALSVIPSVISVMVIYRFVKEKFTPRAALLSGFLLTVSAYSIYFAHEVRMYSFLACFTICALYYFQKLIDSDFGSMENALGFIFITALGLYTHISFVLVLASLSLWLMLYLLSEKGDLFKGRKLFIMKRYIFMMLAVIIIYIPCLYAFIFRQMDLIKGQTWRIPFNYKDLLVENVNFLLDNTLGMFTQSLFFIKSVEDSVANIGLAHIKESVLLIIIIPLNLAAVIYFLFMSFKSRMRDQLLQYFFLFMIIMTAMVFYVTNHIYYLYRYLFFLSPVFAAMMALGYLNSGRMVLKKIFLAVLLGSYGLGLYFYYTEPSRDSDHREIVSIINANYKQGDAIMLLPIEIRHNYLYYFRNSRFVKSYDDFRDINKEGRKSGEYWVAVDYRSKYFFMPSEELLKSPEFKDYKIERVWNFERTRLVLISRNNIVLPGNRISYRETKNSIY